jgi:non-specific serine/threonine protein kinase
MQLPPLDVTLADCLRYESVRLFVERSQAARPDFALNESSIPAIATICRRLDGIPLALELTASRVRGMTPQQIVPRLQNRFHLLDTSRRDLEPRQRSLRGAIDWSYDLLTEEERSLFTELSVFVAGFYLEDVEAVCSAEDALTLIFDLRDKSLIRSEQIGSETRYSMLDTLREYACEKLETAGAPLFPRDLSALKERHARRFLEKAERWAERIGSSDEADTIAQMRLDIDNLRAGMDWAVQRDDSKLVSTYGRALARFFLARGLYSEGGARLQVAEEACRRGGDRVGLAHLLLQRGLLAFQMSDLALARQVVTESYEISCELGDRRRMVPALLNLGNIAWGESDYNRARQQYEEGLELARMFPETRTRYEAMLISNLGLIASEQSDFEAASRYFAEALALHRRNNNHAGIAYTLMNFSDVLRGQKQFGPALEQLEESRQLFESLGHKHEMALTKVRLGLLLMESGRIEEAGLILEEGLRSAREIEDPWSEMFGLAVQGRIAGMEKNLEAALERYRRSLLIAQRVGDRKHQAEILNYAGRTWLENGQREAAYRALSAAYREYTALKLTETGEIVALLDSLRATLGPEVAARLDAEAAAASAEALL